MDRLKRIEWTRFLGREFLTWLWFWSEQREGLFQVAGHGEIELFVEDRIRLEPFEGEGNRHLLTGVAPATSREAGVALHSGKLPSEVKLKVIKEARSWSFTLKGDSLVLASLKIPELLSKTDDDRLYERLYLLEEIESMIQELYRSFLQLRSADRWEEEFDQLQQWIEEKVATL